MSWSLRRNEECNFFLFKLIHKYNSTFNCIALLSQSIWTKAGIFLQLRGSKFESVLCSFSTCIIHSALLIIILGFKSSTILPFKTASTTRTNIGLHA
ncbi:hypothetical protein BVC80_8289g1 [Macleaya cordata]|uniref:Uncharacterized protein n=1 Tax=Macleaya cordata TaxID=56857 RepID=A0A200Q0F7_MACCD|nr:hypothetical protein BVC80_8289g1 [Macleaya cordata]